MREKLAERRHHYQRLKKKQEYRHYWQHILSGMNRISFPETYICIRINTPTPCSCFGCGNPRRHFGEITRAERHLKEDGVQ